VYPKHFPTPPRDNQLPIPDEAKSWGFTYIAEDVYENEVAFSAQELVAYLSTQTNVAAAVAEGRESFESAHHWLIQQVLPFLDDNCATFIYVTRAWYLRKGSIS